MRIFKLRSKWIGGHVRTTVFSGGEGFTLQNCGVLTMSMGDWQHFGALLLVGARMDPSIDIVCEGNEQVIADCEEGRCVLL